MVTLGMLGTWSMVIVLLSPKLMRHILDSKLAELNCQPASDKQAVGGCLRRPDETGSRDRGRKMATFRVAAPCSML